MNPGDDEPGGVYRHRALEMLGVTALTRPPSIANIVDGVESCFRVDHPSAAEDQFVGVHGESCHGQVGESPDRR